MGLPKRQHLSLLLSLEAVRSRWKSVKGREPGEDDLDEMYDELEFVLCEILPRHADPLPGVVSLLAGLRQAGIRTGSCTGYTQGMMDILVPIAADKGFRPDVIVTPDSVPVARPAPFMCYENAVRLGVYPLHTMVKVGDTLADIQEGLNAGMWSVGVVVGGSELGLDRQEVAALDDATLDGHVAEVSRRLFDAGAHFIIRSIDELPEVIEAVELHLGAGERPWDVRPAEGE
jgi:phosphonoacetaldehyde hydrolase